MNKREIFRKIGGIISELTEQYQYLSENIDEINDLELELFIANSNFLSDHIEILRKLNVASSPIRTEPPAALPSLQESVKITLKEENEQMTQSLSDKQTDEPAAGKTFSTKITPKEENEPIVEGFSEKQADEPANNETLSQKPVSTEAFRFEAKDVESSEEETITDELAGTYEQEIDNKELSVPEKEDVSYDDTFEHAAKIEVPQSVRELESFRELENAEEAKGSELISPAFAGDNFKNAETTDVSQNNTFEQAATIEAPQSVQELKSFQQQGVEVEEQAQAPENVTGSQNVAPVSVPTINDLISAQRRPLADPASFNKKSITDLKTGINLNDKLLFIKDLFNGYSLAYSEAIELLNRFDSFDSADKFLKANYAQKNNWAAKQSTADKFYEILERRFSK